MLNFSSIIGKFIKNSSQRELSQIKSTVKKINDLETEIKAIPDQNFATRSMELKEKFNKGMGLEDLIPETFALTREAARRTLGERHYDVQLMGGIILHQGKIAEMKTGEGKTLVSTLPVFLNALTGKGVHVVTVNDYLAKRDSEWMGQIYKFLGLSVGCITNQMEDTERKKNYNCDVTYGTNSEFGFDYLRDNMKYNLDEMVHRNHFFCIVDEVDSILIDEARTPLIISGATEDKSDQYFVSNKFVKKLEKIDYELDEKNKNVMLSEKGIDRIEKLSKSYGVLKNNNFYDPQNINLVHHINQALRANLLFMKDTDYIVVDNKVQIIDEFTGRVLEGRRFSDGLHQALEAKEKVEIQSENQTLASITYQNYFRLYKKLAGMTGTAATEAEEFYDIYKLKTVSVPTNVPMIRNDLNDQIYRTEKEKNNAIVEKINYCKKNNQPVLVGTTSIEKSEKISLLLNEKKINHNVLNAKQHEKEAKIIAEAGRLGSVTIATNMAGRGTDIKISDNIKNKGGLAIIGTERHDSRRVDRQLRGRSGRQGDPGSTQFFVSLEDNLMRLFGTERVSKMMDRMGHKEGDVLEHSMMNSVIERAQKKVEENNFGIRKRLLEYDDVMNMQREVIYKKRKNALDVNRLKVDVANMIFESAESIYLDAKNKNDFKDFEFNLIRCFGITSSISKKDFESQDEIKLVNGLYKSILENYERKNLENIDKVFPIIKNVHENPKNRYERIVVPFTDGKKTMNIVTNLKSAYDSKGKKLIDDFEKNISLAIIDETWKTHLRKMDELRQSVQLAVHEQKDPLLIYKFEAKELFFSMIDNLNKDILTFLMKADLPSRDPNEIKEDRQTRRQQAYKTSKEEVLNSDELARRNRDIGGNVSQKNNMVETITREKRKIGRNERVTVRNMQSGEKKELKFKQAQNLINSGNWIIVEEQ